jgi:hypothetical protein
MTDPRDDALFPRYPSTHSREQNNESKKPDYSYEYTLFRIYSTPSSPTRAFAHAYASDSCICARPTGGCGALMRR